MMASDAGDEVPMRAIMALTPEGGDARENLVFLEDVHARLLRAERDAQGPVESYRAHAARMAVQGKVTRFRHYLDEQGVRHRRVVCCCFYW